MLGLLAPLAARLTAAGLALPFGWHEDPAAHATLADAITLVFVAALVLALLRGATQRLHDCARGTRWLAVLLLPPLALGLLAITAPPDTVAAWAWALAGLPWVTLAAWPGSAGTNRFGPPAPSFARTGRPGWWGIAILAALLVAFAASLHHAHEARRAAVAVPAGAATASMH